jgi:hypothetical protein
MLEALSSEIGEYSPPFLESWMIKLNAKFSIIAPPNIQITYMIVSETAWQARTLV